MSVKKCQMCGRHETAHHRINKHHYKGRKYPDVIYTCTDTCHHLAEFVTQLYLQAGLEAELSEKFFVYFYQRVANLRHSDAAVLHPMRPKAL